MLQNKKYKYKLMDLNSLYRALDRLTRIKAADEKFNKVYNSIITDFLIEPKFSLKQLDALEFSEKKEFVQIIWNESVKQLCSKYDISCAKKPFLNDLLADEENKLFNLNDKNEFFDGSLDIDSLIKLPCPLSPVPVNVQWLLNITENSSLVDERQEKSLKFPIEKFVLAEGITEEILLPVFAKLRNCDFMKKGIHLISAGGKNQVARWYVKNRNLVKVPVFILLDNDAQEIMHTLETILLPKDKIYVIKNGEFEDIIPRKLIKKTINDTFKNDFNITISDLQAEDSMCKTLKQIFHDHKAGDFKKADFAKQVSEEIQKLPCLSEEISEIIAEIEKLGN